MQQANVLDLQISVGHIFQFSTCLHIKRTSYSHNQPQGPGAAHLHHQAHHPVFPAHQTGLCLYDNENKTQESNLFRFITKLDI